MDNVIDYLRDADTVTIATKRANGESRKTSIWAVVVDGVAYVRSVRGPDGVWYSNALREGAATIVMPAGEVPVKVAVPKDSSTASAIDAAYATKYAKYSQDWVKPTVTEPGRSATLMLTSVA